MAARDAVDELVSLGSVFHQPLLLFYRTASALSTGCPNCSGKRLAIGPEGSGTRVLALTLLKANGIEPGGATTLLDLAGDDGGAGAGRRQGRCRVSDGRFGAPPVYAQAPARPRESGCSVSSRRMPMRGLFLYLNALTLPMGAIDLGKNEPAQDLALIGPTVELVAREDLHPALSDLLIDAAQ